MSKKINRIEARLVFESGATDKQASILLHCSPKTAAVIRRELGIEPTKKENPGAKNSFGDDQEQINLCLECTLPKCTGSFRHCQKKRSKNDG